MTIASLFLGIVNAAYITFLLADIAGLIRSPLLITPANAWRIVPLSQCYLWLAHRGMGSWIGSHHARDQILSTGDWTGVMAFSMLLVQCAIQYAACCAGTKSRLAYIMLFPATICLAAWAYYVRLTFGKPNEIAADVLGLTLFPDHHILWLISTSIQVVLWTLLRSLELAGERSCRLPSAPLLLTMLMMWTGLLGMLDFGPCGERTLVPNYALISLCVIIFYSLLMMSTRPLAECANGYKQRRMPNTAFHFQWVVRYVWITWHFFPAIWAASVAGYLGSSQRELLFMIADLTAKFLPVSLFLNIIVVKA